MMIVFLAFLGELIDSGLGMMYGTILSPLLMILGYEPFQIIPAILISQAIGGLVASINHHYSGNAKFGLKTQDTRIALIIMFLGIIGAVSGVWLSNSIPKIYLRYYISILCIFIGILLLVRKQFHFRWIGVFIIGLISSFNKAFSGGGFGPLVTSGQVVFGRESNRAISVTDLAEIPICLVSFCLWTMVNGSSPNSLMNLLIIGSILGALIGPRLLRVLRHREQALIRILGILVVVLGILSLYQLQI